MTSEPDITDEEMDAWLAEWEESDRAAAAVLAQAWPEVRDWEEPPSGVEEVVAAIREGVASHDSTYLYFAPDVAAADADDATGLWLDAASSSMSPLEDPTEERGQTIEEAADIGTLQHADWLALVVGLLRRGVGAGFSGALAFKDECSMDEIDGEPDPQDGVEAALDAAAETLGPLWEALGALDADRRLTPIGHWGLARALYLAWGTDTATIELDPGES
ncbi:MAG: hypothetical protein L0H93_03355 [Nocardioides sp.]|nr:hypothetical protein [Nocardioides sp.]